MGKISEYWICFLIAMGYNRKERNYQSSIMFSQVTFHSTPDQFKKPAANVQTSESVTS